MANPALLKHPLVASKFVFTPSTSPRQVPEPNSLKYGRISLAPIIWSRSSGSRRQATAAQLGFRRPSEAMLLIVASLFPAFDETPMKLLASQPDTVRAWPGGSGDAKLGANYGPAPLATEAGACNIFVVWPTRGGQLQLLTPPLDDKVILDGVTRRSVMELAKKGLYISVNSHLEPLEVLERKFAMLEFEQAPEDALIAEDSAVGTAVFISLLSEIHFRGKDLKILVKNGSMGQYAAALKRVMKDIMYGNKSHEWGVEGKEY
ncbi:MAG: hypothetical protein M1829_000874 [Trizodia sp. TS-e1964]|nr:MAG: hypothetical protein M1829_000874 [Trizodia sp. TS-e1964]